MYLEPKADWETPTSPGDALHLADAFIQSDLQGFIHILHIH